MSAQFRILDFNYAFDSATNVLPLSEDSAFPASNLQQYLRSKVYRSSGYFKITTSNNQLDFKISGAGAQLTAVIPVGSYTPTTLAAMIQTKMNALAALPVTVSQSVLTGKWTIVTSDAYLSLLFGTGTNLASSIAGVIGFESTDQTGALTYTGSHIAIHTEEGVVFDLGGVQDIDSFAIVFDKVTGHKFSNSAVVKLQGHNTRDFSAPAVNVTLSFDDNYSCFTYFFATAQSYRYWRVSVVDTENPYLYVEIPKVVLSLATQLGQMPEIGFTAGLIDQTKQSVTPYGHRYSDVYPNLRSLLLQWTFLTQADAETLQLIFDRLGTVIPFAVVMDPTETLFDKDRFFLFGYFAADAPGDIVNSSFQYFDTTWALQEGF